MANTDLSMGAQAPEFAAPDEQGQVWRLADAVRRNPVVLVFYRGDW